MQHEKERSILGRLENKLDTLLNNLEKSQFLQYIEYTQDRKRMIRNSFFLGIARGIGAAIGFTILGAILWYILQAVAKSSIPLLGDFIAQIVEIVEAKT